MDNETIAIEETQSNLGTPLVSCVGLSKEFGLGETKTLALRSVDVDVFSAQMTLLVGPSGCGKTTLISIIAGLLYPTAGAVTVLGKPLDKMRGGKLIRFRKDNIGFVFQQYNLLPSLTAAENASVPLLIQGWRRKKALEAASEMLNAVGLGNRLQSLPKQLSGGQQQRVAIARALVHRPKLLVCDEPTAALDAKSGQTVMELLRNVAIEPDRAVIVVTHDSRVFSFGDRIIHMSDGAVERVEGRMPSVAEIDNHSESIHHNSAALDVAEIVRFQPGTLTSSATAK